MKTSSSATLTSSTSVKPLPLGSDFKRKRFINHNKW